MWKHACNSLLPNSPGKGKFEIEEDSPILNRFECVRASTHIVPMWDASCVPAVGPISARVVGNGEVDVDDQGRICVQFLFARRDDHSDSGASVHHAIPHGCASRNRGRMHNLEQRSGRESVPKFSFYSCRTIRINRS